MSERKVLSKYYPPDFDPSKLTRTPKHLRPTGPKTISVRLMAPFSMKCTSCGEYIYKGRKFNARKETTEEKYLNLTIYRFYIRCTRCSTEITFKTDPKNMDYACERGAKRNFESWRDPESEVLKETDEQRLDRLEREEMEAVEEEERNAMEELEGRMEEGRREVEVADALDEIRTRNARIERGRTGGKEEAALRMRRDEGAEERERVERELDEAARVAFTRENVERVRLEEESEGGREEERRTEEVKNAPSVHNFERVVKPRNINGVPPLVKKAVVTETKPTSVAITKVAPAAPAALGLGGYDSDDDD